MKLEVAHSNSTQTNEGETVDDGTQEEECVGKRAHFDRLSCERCSSISSTDNPHPHADTTRYK
jgi:hypothetical protein